MILRSIAVLLVYVMLYSTVYTSYMLVQKDCRLLLIMEEEPSQEDHESKYEVKNLHYLIPQNTKESLYSNLETESSLKHCYNLAHNKSEGKKRLLDYPPEV
ncbi:MAG: hypothetical protein R2774_15445 [Saprospiraceae bacterium]